VRGVETILGLASMMEATGLALDSADVPGALEAIARTMGEVLELGVVVVNLYRPEWDDFVVTTVYGPPEAQAALLGATYPYTTWEPLLDERFLHRGAYVIRAGAFDWSTDMGDRYVPKFDASGDEREWQPEDELFIPFRGSTGQLLGVFSIGEPASGLRPSDPELDMLVAVAQLAARSVQGAQQAAAAAGHRRMLEQLLHVSSKLAAASSIEAVLRAVTDGIVAALRFERVAVLLPEADTGLLVPRAATGWSLDDPQIRLGVDMDAARAVFDPAFEVEGCFLLPLEAALARIRFDDSTYHSVRNGRGPLAWNRHWLVVPLMAADGVPVGLVWVDEPVDRLLPSRERLQALRVFADQATLALAAASAFEQLQHLAERDPLTHLLNRRAFHARLQAATLLRTPASGPLSVVFCDLDHFKQLNDAHGHAAGDEALAAFAEALRGAVRSPEEAFRVGGDEFALVLEDCSTEEANRVVTRIRARLSGLGPAGGPLGASFGVASVAPHDVGEGALDLLRRADAAMYEAKRARRRPFAA
jgi:diguanylate cyclase (GGDEF)-like protein